ncbi:MAG: NAD-dependent epimerase/dehydratase family protein [Gemmatimonadales bacterium]
MKRRFPATVLVTGVTGFLGSHLCQALVGRGVAVRALVRRAESPLPLGVSPHIGDLQDVPAVRRAMSGVNGVIHLAAHVHGSSADPNTIHRVNVDATMALLETAASAGATDFFFASSVKAVGEANVTPWTESTPPDPADAYGKSKLQAERLVRDFAERNGIHAPILRLPLVYGPGMKANALRLFRMIDRGVPLPFRSVRNRRSLLFTGNLVLAALATIESPKGSDTFFVSDDEDLSTPMLVTAVARALGRPARLVSVPETLLRAAARISPAIARLVGSLAVEISRLKAGTGYAPAYPVAEGLRMTAEWFRAEVA